MRAPPGYPIAGWNRSALGYTSFVRALPPALQHALRDDGENLSFLVVRLGALGDILRPVPPDPQLSLYL